MPHHLTTLHYAKAMWGFDLDLTLHRNPQRGCSWQWRDANDLPTVARGWVAGNTDDAIADALTELEEQGY